MLARVERFRSGDGGYSTQAGEELGSCVRRVSRARRVSGPRAATCPHPDRVLDSLQDLRASDGSYGNHPGTAVRADADDGGRRRRAATPRRQPDRDAGMWLLDRCHSSGGFFAAT